MYKFGFLVIQIDIHIFYLHKCQKSDISLVYTRQKGRHTWYLHEMKI